MDLGSTTALLRLLSDPTRVRLLALLEREELTVAELSAVMRLAQPRVSTHLAKLKEADLVRDRRAGVSAYYRVNSELEGKSAALLLALQANVSDGLIDDDARRLPTVLARRARAEGWADSVAGDMERHYSPGRTWEAFARALTGLIEVGDVLDIASGDGVLAELLAPHADSILCLDASERVVTAARARLKPGGRLLATTLARHAHRNTVAPFDHRNLGFRNEELREFARKAGLEVLSCERVTRERRPPHFEVVSLLARNPS